MKWRRKRKTVGTLPIRARHEACHVIVALAQDFGVDTVDVIEQGVCGGNTRWRSAMPIMRESDTPQGRANAQLEIMAVMLAPRVGNRTVDDNLKVTCSQDLLEAIEIARLVVEAGTGPTGLSGSLDVGSLVAFAEARAADLLDEFSSFVDELAASLVETDGEHKVGRGDLVTLRSKMAWFSRT